MQTFAQLYAKVNGDIKRFADGIRVMDEQGTSYMDDSLDIDAADWLAREISVEAAEELKAEIWV